jgi:uncharacterized PurR-regulated membrane protein YhhQ (DUF165 family)
MILVECVGFVYYASRSRFALQGFAVVNMVMALLLSRKLGTFFGSATSVGCVWYTAVLATQVHIKLFYGRKAVVDSAFMLVSTSALFVALVVAASLVPPVDGNEAASGALTRWVDGARYTVPASFLGYAVAQTIILAVIGKVRCYPWAAALLAMVLAQVADTFVYFPAAFRNLDVDALGLFAAAGIKLKLYATAFLWMTAVIDWRYVFSKTHQRTLYAMDGATNRNA